jgi:hypothetical protein
VTTGLTPSLRGGWLRFGVRPARPVLNSSQRVSGQSKDGLRLGLLHDAVPAAASQN